MRCHPIDDSSISKQAIRKKCPAEASITRMFSPCAGSVPKAEVAFPLPVAAGSAISPSTLDDISFKALVESMSIPWNVPQPFLSPPIDGTFDFGNHLGPKGEQDFRLPETSSLMSSYSSSLQHPQPEQTLNSGIQAWPELQTTPSPTGSSSGGSSTSALPIVSPTSTIGSLSPGSTQMAAWIDQSTGSGPSSHTETTASQPFEGSMLGLYESIMAWNTQETVTSNSFIPGPANHLDSEESSHGAFGAEFPLRRRARSSFSSHRRAVQKSKSASMLKCSRDRRETCPPPAIVVPAPLGSFSGETSASMTPGLKRPSPLKHRASSFLDVDPAASGLKSPTKVLAYQARVRQQRSAMRAIIDDIKFALQPLVDTITSLPHSSLMSDLGKLVNARTDGEPVCTPIGRSRASSRASEQSQHSRTSSCAGLPAYDMPFHTDLAGTHSLQGWISNHSQHAYLAHQMVSQQGQPVAPTFWQGQASSEEGCPATQHNINAEEKLRSRQKNAYKQRLRSEELVGIEFLSSLAKVIVTHAQKGSAADRFDVDEQALTAVKTAVWKHRADWDLLLAAERRLGWGSSIRSKGDASGRSSLCSQSDEAQAFGVLVPFFFLSYPSATS